MSEKNTTPTEKMSGEDVKNKVGNYLTDMKELPPNPINEKVSVLKPKAAQADTPIQNNLAPVKKNEKTMADVAKVNLPKKTEVLSDDDFSNKTFTSKDIFLAVTNFIVLAVLIFVLTRLPQKAQEFKTERITEIQNQLDPAVEHAGITEDMLKSQELEKLFLDEAGVVEFVGSVEGLKTDNPAIQRVTFANQRAIKDTMGLSGVPAIVEMRGDWMALGRGLEKVQSLPYLFKPVSVEIMPSENNPQVFDLKYGGFLYVKEEPGN